MSSRSNSPYRQIDVPRGIEDGSDSDAAGELASPMPDQRHSLPPIPPSKDGDEHLDVQSPVLSEDPDASGLSQHDASDDMSESSPVERTSHATFIAPALPPIRFSLSGADFSELLNSVQGPSALKSLDGMATLLQESDDLSTPPKTSSERTSTAPTPPPATAGEHTPHDTPKSSAAEERHGFNKYVSKNRAPSSRTQHHCRPLEIKKKASVEDKPLPVLNLPPNPIEPQQSNDQLTDPINGTHITVTDSSSGETTVRHHASDPIAARLREAIKGSRDQGVKQIRLDVELIEAAIATLDSSKVAYDELKEKFDGMKVRAP